MERKSFKRPPKKKKKEEYQSGSSEGESGLCKKWKAGGGVKKSQAGQELGFFVVEESSKTYKERFS